MSTFQKSSLEIFFGFRSTALVLEVGIFMIISRPNCVVRSLQRLMKISALDVVKAVGFHP